MTAVQESRPIEIGRSETAPAKKSNAMLRRHAERLIATEIAFVYRPTKGTRVEAEIDDLDEFLEGISADDGSRRLTAESHSGRGILPVPDHLLTPDQERRLFLQMNYLKYRANAFRSRLDPAKPSREHLAEIEALLADVKRIRDCLCECNLRLVLSVARKLSNSHFQYEEFVSEGLPILLRCLELFDASRGFRFSTYLTHSVQRRLYRVLQINHRLRQRQSPTNFEILETVPEAERFAEAEIDHAAIFRSLWQSGRRELDEREQLIVMRRFGLDGSGTQSLRQIAGDLGISRERVRQLQIRAMDKLHDVARSLKLNATFE